MVTSKSATLQGIEVTTGATTDHVGARLDVNYTYLDASAHDNGPLGTDLLRPCSTSRSHRFNGTLQVFLPWQFVFRTEGLYTSSNSSISSAASSPVDGFTLWNVQVTRPSAERLSVFAEPTTCSTPTTSRSSVRRNRAAEFSPASGPRIHERRHP